MSGRQDSNLRPPAPKAGALTGLRYAPKQDFVLKAPRFCEAIAKVKFYFVLCNPISKKIME